MDREAEEPTIEETYLDINDHYLYENKWDETTGKHLDPKLVMAGRTKELTRCAERAVWDAMPRDEAMKLKDVKYVKTRWVETMKDGEVRSRFVAQEFAAGDPRTDLFAGTPHCTLPGWSCHLLPRADRGRDTPKYRFVLSWVPENGRS